MALLVNSDARISRLYVDTAQAAAVVLGLTSPTFEWRSLDELQPAFDAMVRADVQALITNPDGLAFTHRLDIARLALVHRLPLSVWSRETLMAGAVMSYGADGDAICRRTAVYVDKILKGAKPSDLPVEQPTKFELLINLKTAEALGLTVPEPIRLRADAVIE